MSKEPCPVPHHYRQVPYSLKGDERAVRYVWALELPFPFEERRAAFNGEGLQERAA